MRKRRKSAHSLNSGELRRAYGHAFFETIIIIDYKKIKKLPLVVKFTKGFFFMASASLLESMS